jgi:VWFA-related protein
LPGTSGLAQEPTVFRSERREVVIPVTVTGRDRQPVTGLGAEDFVVRDRGRRYRVVAVEEIPGDGEPACNMPTEFRMRQQEEAMDVRDEKAVWIDTNNLEFREIRESVEGFVKAYAQSGQPKPRWTYVSDRRGLSLVEGIWDSFEFQPAAGQDQAQSLRAQTDRLMRTIAVSGDKPDELSETPDLKVRRILRTLREIAAELRLRPGRKQLLWVGGGFHFKLMLECCKDQWDLSMEQIIDANVEISGLDGGGVRLPGGFSASMTARESYGAVRGRPGGGSLYSRKLTDTLRVAAAETGGQFFGNTNDLAKAYRDFAAMTTHYYEVSIAPEEKWFDGKKHSFDVDVKRRHTTVRHRRGYRAVFPEAAAKVPFETLLQMAAENVTESRTMCLGAAIVPTPDRGTLRVLSWVNGRHLALQSGEDGRYRGELRLLVLQSDGGGKEIARKDFTLRLTFGAAEYAKLGEEGLAVARDLPVADGGKTVVVVAGDARSGRIGSVRVPIP